MAKIKTFPCKKEEHKMSDWHQGRYSDNRIKKCLKCNHVFSIKEIKEMYPEQFETRNSLPVKKFDKNNCYLESRFLI